MKSLAVALAALLSLPANAQTVSCATRDAVVDKLTRLGEAQAGLGLNGSGQIMEIWASRNTGTWTIVMSWSDGRSCIMSYGESWTGLIPDQQDAPA